MDDHEIRVSAPPGVRVTVTVEGGEAPRPPSAAPVSGRAAPGGRLASQVGGGALHMAGMVAINVLLVAVIFVKEIVRAFGGLAMHQRK